MLAATPISQMGHAMAKEEAMLSQWRDDREWKTTFQQKGCVAIFKWHVEY